MDPLTILEKYYSPGALAHQVLVTHSRMVAEKALRIAHRVRHLHPDEQFIQEAAMLHDIGIFFTKQPQIGCFGDREYICHGFLGRELLEKEDLPKHALVCERHVGAGITLQEIENKNLPVPRRDMAPVSLEEELICFADKFFSKNPEYLLKEKPVELVRKGIARYGEEKLQIFDQWVKIFGA
ncbi:MAG: HD domain-containing protein [Thermodesulfovibrionales bacterium]|nr:HD domain-containing protein [Thermodesulfovibrionales bacterium]